MIILDFRVYTINSGRKRAEYARKYKIFGCIGENVMINDKIIPLYSQLIWLHDNVKIAKGVEFFTHDVIHSVYNCIHKKNLFKEHVGCIEIMENCFIGANSTILFGVRIGPNTIVGGGSLVCSNLESNAVYAGVPAKKIGSFNDTMNKRL